MNDLILSKICSFYPSMFHTRHRETAKLSAWLNGDFNGYLYAAPIGKEWEKVSPEHRAALEKYFVGKPVIECLDRYRADLAKKGKTPFNSLVKNRLPAITPSAVLSYRNGNSVSDHTGLLAGDIDLKENPFTAASLRAFLAKIENVAYAGLSASGRGIWFLVPIADPEQHRAHFAALRSQLKKHGLNLDPMPANVASLRFFSYDEAAYFNPSALPYTRMEVAENRPQRDSYASQGTRAEGGNTDKVEAILKQLEARYFDLTEAYQDWFAIGCAFASEFGEAGRDYFHQVSQFYLRYQTAETDKQYTKCLGMGVHKIGIATFFEVAKRQGFEYRGHLPVSWTMPTLPAVVPLPTSIGQCQGQNEAAPKVVLNEHGYPAAWDT